MATSARCPNCGLVQMARAICKACGATMTPLIALHSRSEEPPVEPDGAYLKVGVWKLFSFAVVYAVLSLTQFLLTNGGWLIIVAIYGAVFFAFALAIFLIVALSYSRNEENILCIRKVFFWPTFIFTLFYQTFVAVFAGQTYFDDGGSYFIESLGISRRDIPSFVLRIAEAGYLLYPILILVLLTIVLSKGFPNIIQSVSEAVQYDDAEILEIARRQKAIIWLVLLGVLGCWIPMLWLVLAPVYMYLTYKLAVALLSRVPSLYVVLSIIPLIQLFVLLLLNAQATGALRKRGLRVSLMGARNRDLEALR